MDYLHKKDKTNIKKGELVTAVGVPKILLPYTLLHDKTIIGVLDNEIQKDKVVIKLEYSPVYKYRLNDLIQAGARNREVIIKGEYLKYNNYPCINVKGVKLSGRINF